MKPAQAIPECGPVGSFNKINLIVGTRQTGRTEELLLRCVAAVTRARVKSLRPNNMIEDIASDCSMVFLHNPELAVGFSQKLRLVLGNINVSDNEILFFRSNKIDVVVDIVKKAINKGTTPQSVYVDDFISTDITALKNAIIELPRSIVWHVVLD